ncbi:DeoR/GlpR family DNA-binding transcription regulator [Phytoactinopolyspora limicola]|uniref:DeoR/GlpR family DNA-binding transcription regulator n=1 Tax=Phytoactinopolyspora limicola TaxID=2715536 RepID=UPI00140DDCF1|nr:DeoR/GlpR family DNA-binding transcription regulator [Phytoactinopolyspora limicola]
MPRATRRRSARISAIVDRLARGAKVNVRELAGEFGVSAGTIRRDLLLLEQQGILSRTHGGAVSSGRSTRPPVPFRRDHTDVKREIAERAVRSIPHGNIAVGLNGGSTTLEVARLLARRIGLMVATNSLSIATELAGHSSIRLWLTGGINRSSSHQLVGPDTIRSLHRITVDVAIVGVDGVTAQMGLTIDDDAEAAGAAALVSRARRVVVVADGSKVGRVTRTPVSPITDIDELITDATANAAEVDHIRHHGITVSTDGETQGTDHYLRMRTSHCALSTHT